MFRHARGEVKHVTDDNIRQNDNYNRPRPSSPDLDFNFNNYDAGSESLRNRFYSQPFVKIKSVSKSRLSGRPTTLLLVFLLLCTVILIEEN